MRKKFIIIISFLLLVLYGSFSIYACIDYINEPDMRDYFKEDCEKYYSGDREGLSWQALKFCEERYYKKDGFLSMHYLLVLDKYSSIAVIVVAITIATSVIWPCLFWKNKMLLNYIIRLPYKSVLKKILKEAYRYIWILPTIMLLVFLFEIHCEGLDNSYSIIIQDTGWQDSMLKHPICFIVLYLINMLLYLSTFINIGLICSRKNFNYFTSVIVAFLVIISIQIFFEYVIDRTQIINLLNFFRFNDMYGTWLTLGFGMTCCLISCLVVYLAFKNKEKLYLDINKER